MIAILLVNIGPILLCERREGVECSNQGCIVSFHDNGSGEQDGEEHCLLIKVEGLSQTHRLLRIGSLLGVDSDIDKIWIGDRHFAHVGISQTKNIVVMFNVGDMRRD